MPRYFFHTADGGRDWDQEGVELDGDASARVEAIRFGGALVKDSPEMLGDGKEFRVEVTDEADQLLCTIVMLAVQAPRLARAERSPGGS